MATQSRASASHRLEPVPEWTELWRAIESATFGDLERVYRRQFKAGKPQA